MNRFQSIPTAPMARFDPRHAIRIASALAEIDARVTEAVHALDPASLASPVTAVRADVARVRERLLAAEARRLRTVIDALIRRYRIPVPDPGVDASSVARVALDHAVIAAEELGPRYLCTSGALSPGLAGEADRIVTVLLDRLERMQDMLDGDLEHGDAKNPARTDLRQNGDVAIEAALDEIAATIADHRLAGLQPVWSALARRAARGDLEVTVWGRVNVGKSSLLNLLAGRAILPVGSLPVKSATVRLVWGAESWGTAVFADAATERFAATRLQEFASAQFNPANERHVTALTVEIPSPLLRERITLVDRPGEAFAIAGDSYAWPTCDIGLVVIDATSGLDLEEAAIVDRLEAAGSSVLVVATRADRLDASERWRVQGHIERGLAALTRRDVRVFLASATSEDPALCRDWIERGLKPLLALRDQVRGRSLETKVELLRDAANKGARRMRRAIDARIAEGAAGTYEREIERLLEIETRATLDEGREARIQAAALIDDVADNAAILWHQGIDSSLDVLPLVSDALEARANGVSRTAAKRLTKLRARCGIVLEAFAASAGITGTDARSVFGAIDPPLFPSPALLPSCVVKAPLLPVPGAWQQRGAVKRLLRSALVRSAIIEALATHVANVEAWRLRWLADARERCAGLAAAPDTWRDCARATRPEERS